MVRKRSAIQMTDGPRKPLESISNRKRQQSPSANCDDLIEPPNKKQKISQKKSKSDKKEEESNNHEESVFLSNYTFKTITIKRIQFDDEQLKFNILSNKNKDNDNWIQLSDIFNNAFKYSSPSHPTSKQTTKQFINALNLFLKRHGITHPSSVFYMKVNKKCYISEKGFCILLFFMSEFDNNNAYVDLRHFSMYRFYYRRQIFGRTISGFNINPPQSIDNIEEQICRKCCLEDIESNFYFENPCDCSCVLHLKCSEINSFTIPNNENKLKKWFCPFCICSGVSINKLVKRRNNFNDSGDFEIEKVIDYDINDDKYTVTWKHYPNEACCKIEISYSFMELINVYWSTKQIPLKAQNGINLIMKDIEENDIDIDIHKQMTNLDIKMKSNIVENNKFIPVKLGDIMDKKYIIRRQKYTKETYERYKLTRDKYRKWLQKEVQNETIIGMDLKREMKYSKNNNKRLPKYHLRSINKDWDCDLPRIRDIIINFLNKNWNKWEHNYNVSHESFVIGDIIDPENPALKYGCEQGVHTCKAYGLFAIKKIIKDTLLFEYSGCVKPVGDASKQLDHLETELDQTTLFDLIGHLENDRSKLFWGTKVNDALVIDPSRWHNEGVYMNDYRDRVMDDPDDDEQVENNKEIENNNNKNKNKNHNQMRKQNVKFYEVLVNNWPRVFAVAIDDIQSGQELLGDYGCDFWANFRVMMKRQRQLTEIKTNINNEWEEKYNKLQIKCQQQQKEIEQLKTELMASMK